MAAPNEVTHGQILLEIGELKGQVTTLVTLVGQKREDLNNAFTRIGAIEKSAAAREEIAVLETRINSLETGFAKWGGVVLACSFIVPLLIAAAQPYLHLGGKPAAAITTPEAPR